MQGLYIPTAVTSIDHVHEMSESTAPEVHAICVVLLFTSCAAGTFEVPHHWRPVN